MENTGGATVSIDAKGRLVLPARLRSRLAEDGDVSLVVVPSPDRCLALYTPPVWDEVRERLEADVDDAVPEHREAKRVLLGMAQEVEIDGNGRILVPPLLRKLVGLGRRAFLGPNGNKYEIWDESAWLAKVEQLFSAGLATSSLHNILSGK